MTDQIIIQLAAQLGVAIIFIWLYLRAENERQCVQDNKDKRERELITLLLDLREKEAERAVTGMVLTEKVVSSLNNNTKAFEDLSDKITSILLTRASRGD